MKNSHRPPSATSLPRAPRDEAGGRSRRYLMMMGVRIACLALMVLVMPYGWYTWVFAAGAIFLPYIAVVLANVGQEGNETPIERPDRVLPASPTEPERPTVIRVDESRPIDAPEGDHRNAEDR